MKKLIIFTLFFLFLISFISANTIEGDAGFIYTAGLFNRSVVKYDKDFNIVAVSPNYGGFIYDIALDNDYVYYGGTSTQTVRKAYKTNLSTITESPNYGDDIQSISLDDDYVYYGGSTTQTVRKAYKTNLSTIADSPTYGGQIMSISLDDDYVYYGGTTPQTVRKAYKTNLSTIAESPNYGGAILSISLDDDYVYYGGYTPQTIRKAYKTNLSTITDSPTYGGEIWSISLDDDYVYYGGSTTRTVRKAYKTNLSTIADSPTYGGQIMSISLDDDYVYYGGYTTRTVRKAYKTNLTTITNSPNYGGEIRTIILEELKIDIILLNPQNYYETDSKYINFELEIRDNEFELGIQNISLVINDSIVQTNSSGLNGTYNFLVEDLEDGYYEWYIEAYDLNSKNYKSNTRYFNHQMNPPKIEMIYPYGLIDFVYIIGGNQILPLNFKVIDSLLSHVWYNYNGTNVSINDLLNGEEIFNRERNILNPSQISLTSGTLTKIDEIEIDGYVINMSAELMSSSTSYNKELVQYIIYKNGTTISQSNRTSSTSFIKMYFINPNPLEQVEKVEYWGREVSTSGTGYVRNRQVNFHLQEYINLTTKKNITIYANDTLGNLAEETFNWTYETVIYNITTYNETEYCYDNSINYEDIPDGIYEAEAITCTNESLCNSTDARTFYVDTTYPLIEYAPNSDLTNITGNFTDKDWIFVNVTYTEINEANVTFTLMDQTGDLQVITFDDFPTIWEQDNDYISYNFTDLDDSMYFYAVRICDKSNNCNTTEVQYYGVETTNLTLDFNYTDLDLELGSPIMINATNNLGQVCVDVDHPAYGDNYSCGTYKTSFELVIDYFSKKLFSNGEEYQEFTFTGEENKSYNLTSHKYDTLDNLSFNILGNATLLRFYNYASGIIERGFFGSLIGDKIYLNETLEVNETTFIPFLTPENNLTFTTSGVSSVYLLMDDNAKDINLSFDVYGEEFGLDYENYLNTTEEVNDTDFDLTTARVGGGFIVPGGNNPMNFTYDDFTDATVNTTLWDFLQTNGHYSVSGWGLDITNGESIGKIYLNALASEGSGDDTFTFQDFLSTNISYLNTYSTDNIKITLNYSGFGENRADYGSCNIKNRIYFGEEEVWTSSDEKVCRDINSDGSYGSCTDYFVTDNGLNVSIIKNLNNSWTLSLEGTERVYGVFWNDDQGWNCGTKTRLYNWTEGILYVTHSRTEDPECQDYNESIDNSYIIYNLNASNTMLSLSHYLNGRYFNTYNDGCKRMSNNLEIKNITQTLYNVTNSSYYTISLLDTYGEISHAETAVSFYVDEPDYIIGYLSSDNGNHWEEIENGETHIFENKGTNLKARYDFVLDEGGYRTSLPSIAYYNVSTPKGYPTNLSFMLGDTIYATIDGELNETNSPQTIIIENPNTTNMFRGQTFQSTDEPFNHLYDVPLRIFSDSTGFVTVNNYNLTYDPNPIILNVSDMQEYLYDSEEDWNIFELIVKGQNGDLNITGLEFDYAGGNYTIPITAHNDLYTRTVTRFVNYFFTMWDYVFGSPTISYLEFIPLSPTSKNVSAYGQTNTVPIINLTHLGYYEGKNASISLKLDNEQDDACVNLTISKTNNKSEGFLLNTTWQEFETNVSYLDNTPIWMWADYQCNYSNWRLWQPNFYVRYCCDGCVCSEEV